MADQCELVCNMKLHTKLSKILVVKLSTIIDDDGVWQTEFVNNEFLNEVIHLAFCDLRQRFGFYPFGKVVDDDHYKFSLTRYREKKIKYVNPPLYEGPWSYNRRQLTSWLMLYICILLTWFTPSDEFSCVIFYSGPIISLSQDFIS